ncbi:MAG TPA: hypothetical protein VGD36_18215, partial [Xanthobacteraceae bacterium]
HMSAKTAILCPTCKMSYAAKDGIAFHTHWNGQDEKGQPEKKYGFGLFCSTTCILNFSDHEESGHA